jgi:hypothetical protein
MSSGTFAAFSKMHLNTSKSTLMKFDHLVEGHNFRVDWHFKFWVEISEKLGQPPVPPVFQNRPTFNVGMTFLQNLLRKTLDGLYKSCRGYLDLQLSYLSLWALLFNFLEFRAFKQWHIYTISRRVARALAVLCGALRPRPRAPRPPRPEAARSRGSRAPRATRPSPYRPRTTSRGS